jgi:hypothetical protein
MGAWPRLPGKGLAEMGLWRRRFSRGGSLCPRLGLRAKARIRTVIRRLRWPPSAWRRSRRSTFQPGASHSRANPPTRRTTRALQPLPQGRSPHIPPTTCQKPRSPSRGNPPTNRTSRGHKSSPSSIARHSVTCPGRSPSSKGFPATRRTTPARRGSPCPRRTRPAPAPR